MLNHINVVNVTVVPAQPGYRLIFGEFGGTDFHLGDCEVIAWRVETFTTHDNEELRSSVTPLDPSGDSSALAVLTPNGRVDEFCAATYESYEAFLAAKRQGRS